jgi:hypothetical protein
MTYTNYYMSYIESCLVAIQLPCYQLFYQDMAFPQADLGSSTSNYN